MDTLKEKPRDLGGTQRQTDEEASWISDWFPSPAPVPLRLPVLLVWGAPVPLSNPISSPAVSCGFLLLATNGALGKQLWWMDVYHSQDVNVVLLMKIWVSQMFPQIFFLFLFYILLWKFSNSYKSRQNEVMNPMCYHQGFRDFQLMPPLCFIYTPTSPHSCLVWSKSQTYH